MTTVYVAMLEDHEGCGTIEDRLTVHTNAADAEASFLKMFHMEYDRYGVSNIVTAEDATDWLEDEHGKTGGVTEVLLDRMYA